MNVAEQWNVLTNARKSIPVPVHELLGRLGIKLKQAWLADGISGMLENIGETFLITINALDSDTRQRFTLAHEIGHYMLHRHLVGDGVDDDRAYRSTQVGKYHNTLIGPFEEREANKFAANLLMPRESGELEAVRRWSEGCHNGFRLWCVRVYNVYSSRDIRLSGISPRGLMPSKSWVK